MPDSDSESENMAKSGETEQRPLILRSDKRGRRRRKICSESETSTNSKEAEELQPLRLDPESENSICSGEVEQQTLPRLPDKRGRRKRTILSDSESENLTYPKEAGQRPLVLRLKKLKFPSDPNSENSTDSGEAELLHQENSDSDISTNSEEPEQRHLEYSDSENSTINSEEPVQRAWRSSSSEDWTDYSDNDSDNNNDEPHAQKKCQVCRKRLKLPKLLPCRHSFCLRPCLKSLVTRRGLRCPECRVTHAVPFGRIACFPADLATIRLLHDLPDGEGQEAEEEEEHPQAGAKALGGSRNSSSGGCQMPGKKKKSCGDLEEGAGAGDSSDNFLTGKKSSRPDSEEGAGCGEGECTCADTKAGPLTRCCHCHRELCGSCVRAHMDTVRADSHALLAQMRRTLPQMAPSINQVDSLESHCASLKSDVKETVERRIRELGRREQEMLREVDTFLAKETPGLRERQEKLEDIRAGAKNFCHCTQSTLSGDLSHGELVELKRQCQEMAQTVDQSDRLPPPLHHRNILLGPEARALHTAVRDFGLTVTSALGTVQGGVRAIDYGEKGRLTKPVLEFGRKGRRQGRLCSPSGVAVWPRDDSIFVTDSYNDRVQVFTSAGVFVKAFGSKGRGNGEFDMPIGITITGAGDVVVSDFNNHRVQIFDIDGRFKSAFGSKGADEGQLDSPCGVACDSKGRIYVCDKGNDRIQIFKPNGAFANEFGSRGTNNGCFDDPWFVAVSADDKVYVSDMCDRIQVFNTSGSFLFSFGSSGDLLGEVMVPRGIAIDNQGFVVVAECSNNRLQVFHADGRYVTVFGWEGKKGPFGGLEGVAILSDGNIVAALRDQHSIRIY